MKGWIVGLIILILIAGVIAYNPNILGKVTEILKGEKLSAYEQQCTEKVREELDMIEKKAILQTSTKILEIKTLNSSYDAEDYIKKWLDSTYYLDEKGCPQNESKVVIITKLTSKSGFGEVSVIKAFVCNKYGELIPLTYSPKSYFDFWGFSAEVSPSSLYPICRGDMINYTVFSTYDDIEYFGMKITLNNETVFDETKNLSGGGIITAKMDLADYVFDVATVNVESFVKRCRLDEHRITVTYEIWDPSAPLSPYSLFGLLYGHPCQRG